MDLYGQQTEVQLLAALITRLPRRSVIDVGAERGGFVEAFLHAGATAIHAIEPEPDNAAALRTKFANEPRVAVLEYAIAKGDAQVELRKSVTPDGEPLPYGHTLLDRPDTRDIAWRESIPVFGRSLASLVESGEVPRRAGILKVDAEGSDFDVISALGDLRCDVVVLEHWLDLPHSLGRCPWTIDDLTGALRPRGFLQFAFLEHRGEFAVLKWNDADVGVGRMGNLIFVHRTALQVVLPVLLQWGGVIAEENVDAAERYAAAAHARLDVIQRLEQERPLPVESQPPRSRWERARARLRFWTRPRLGTLRHHDPRPLNVPARYAALQPPHPAPTISLVTPSLQQGRYLERTLASVLSQEYPALEYVVQDGGSTDETIEVLRRFESALTRWRSELDAGQGDAINRAFRETTGEIMAWLNADDLLLPGSLAYVARYFADHPDVDVVYGNRITIDERDGQIGKWVLPAHDEGALILADYVPQETLFWRRQIWEAVGGEVDARFSYALDWDLLIRFRGAGAKMVRLPRYLGAFRVHDEQKTTALEPTGALECDVIRQRVHGRPMTSREAFERLRPYLIRSMLADMRQRVVDRATRRCVVVLGAPPAGPLQARDEESALLRSAN
jgi:FkbM family methyltransferase